MDDAVVLTRDLRQIALTSGAELFGVADLAQAKEFIEEQGGPFVASFPRAISVAMNLSPANVEQVVDHKSAPVARAYRFYVYQVVNPNLDQILAALVRHLVRAGHRAYLIPASGDGAYVVPASDALDKEREQLERERLRGIFSHKVAAHLAGLGHIGKACLLVTKKYGARVRLGTILTDAPLEVGTPLDRGCEACNRCVEICPVHAFTGVEFRPEDPREVRFKAHLCLRYLDHRGKTMAARACGLCVLACDGGGVMAQAGSEQTAH